MKMKIVSAFLLIILSSVNLFGQNSDTLTIIDCYRLARNHSPQLEMFNINRSISELNVDNYSSMNLPEISGYGKAWYQSDAVAVPPLAPGAEGFSIDRFQYNFGVEVQQKLFDGGIISKQIQLEERSLNTKNAETEASVYKIYDQVNQLYFSILSITENKNLLRLKGETLDEQIKIMESGVKNGVILRSELDKLKVEKMKLNQQLLDLQYSLATLNKNLSILLGINDDNNLTLSSNPDLDLAPPASRPEYILLEKNEEKLTAIQELKNTTLIPKFSAYGQIGYSYPGLNFFENQSDPYYIVGVKLGWKIFDWNETKKEKEILGIQKSGLAVQKEELDRNILIAENTKLDEINKLNDLIQKDQEIISVRESITKSSASALKNGAITSADFIVDLNAEVEAKLNMNRNKIRLLQNKAELLVIRGIDIE